MKVLPKILCEKSKDCQFNKEWFGLVYKGQQPVITQFLPENPIKCTKLNSLEVADITALCTPRALPDACPILFISALVSHFTSWSVTPSLWDSILFICWALDNILYLPCLSLFDTSVRRELTSVGASWIRFSWANLYSFIFISMQIASNFILMIYFIDEICLLSQI